MTTFTATSCYEELDTNPIRLRAGDHVSVSHRDNTWPGWVWAIDAHGNDGYIPESILKAEEGGRFLVKEDFDPTVLTVRKGETLTSLRQNHGWHWCQNADGGQGWVAGYLLRPGC